MSYGTTAALQAAIYGCLTGDAQVGALTGGHVYDALPEGALPPMYVSLGPETVRDATDGSAGGAQHDVLVTVHSAQPGYAGAKAVAAAVSDALLTRPVRPARGRVVAVRFLKARARSARSERRVEMWFRLRLDDI